HESVYRIRAADSLAWADTLLELGVPEDDRHVVIFREGAARDIEWEKKDHQTTCDGCGSDLAGWSCYSGTRNGQTVKLCRKCAG
ncbi:MAG: hypothetical protein WC331_11625, partial [Candidatus Omnitrophota bacterium]